VAHHPWCAWFARLLTDFVWCKFRLRCAAIVFADKLPLHEGLNPANPGLRFKQHRGGRGVAAGWQG
jgi:hypothetical protein